MRTKLLFSLTLFFMTGYIVAQNLVLSHEGETLEPNAEITVEGSSMDPEIIVELAVTNNCSASIHVLCQRYELDMVAGSMSAICWAGLCYPPNTSLSPLATTIGPGVTIDNDFSGHYYPQGNAGVSTIAYTFFDQENAYDSVMVIVHYDGLTVGIGENKHSTLAAYPNPADDFITIDLGKNEAGQEVTIKLVNASGAVVLETIATGLTTRISTGQLAEGVYMYQAFEAGTLIASDKVIIRH